jgi:DNA-binding IclR family transcriptional regulator
MTANEPLDEPTGELAGSSGTESARESSPAQAPTVASRVVSLLELVGRRDGGIGAREAERLVGIDRSTASRIFRQLEQLGWVEQVDDRGTYTVGPGLFAVAAAVRERDSLWRAAAPLLLDLTERFDETTYVAVLERHQVVFKHKVDCAQRIQYVLELNQPHPLTTGAAGRAILSASPRPVVDDVIGNGLRAYTPASITDPQDYRAQLATDARLGYAYSRSGWVEGGAGVGSPFFAASGDCLGALTLSAPIDRLTAEAVSTIGPAVRAAAHHLSCRLGYSGDAWGDGDG